MVSEELSTENVLSCSRKTTEGGCPFWFQSSYRWRMIFLVSEELQTEDALSDSEELDGGCPFWFQISYRRRMPFQVSEELLTKNTLMVSEELPMENALNAFRGVTDGEYPFWLQRS